MSRGLHHVALGSPDVERLATFYREVFGLPERARHLDSDGVLRSIWLDLDGVLLMIERTSCTGKRVEGVGWGPFLLAFSATVTERVALENALASRGCPIETRSPFTSYGRDPDGHRIAISHYPEPAPPSRS